MVWRPHREGVRVLVIGATNRADLLDPALLRPGRFDRLVDVDLLTGWEASHTGYSYQEQTACRRCRHRQGGRRGIRILGAHLESLTNEAAIMALRADERINMNDFSEAMEKVIMGERVERKPDEEELRRVAVHELGHAIVSELVRPGSVAAVTVSSRGKAMGYVRQSPKSDTTSKQLRNWRQE